MIRAQTFEKTSSPGYLINRSTNMVINTNERDLVSYRRQVTESQAAAVLREEHEALKSDVASLKEMIGLLIKR